jgi:hypothetical protein
MSEINASIFNGGGRGEGISGEGVAPFSTRAREAVTVLGPTSVEEGGVIRRGEVEINSLGEVVGAGNQLNGWWDGMRRGRGE